MSEIKLRNLFFLQVILVFLFGAAACNSKSAEEETEIVVTSSIVAVKSFSLKSDNDILENLDSVFFSIDLNTGVIFNADSLPKGTDVSKLVPVITFANQMTKVNLTFIKDNETETVDYLTNATDSIDFSEPVNMDVVAADGVTAFTYKIKVNVHLQEPDSLIWTRISYSSLPSRYPNPVAQKTIYHNETAYCLIEEYNGDFTLSTCNDLNQGIWSSEDFNPGFSPNIESFTPTEYTFYLLSDTGNLYSSADLTLWQDCSLQWITILGAYNNNILGLTQTNGNTYHTIYPAPQGYTDILVDQNFPLSGSSSLGIIETSWANKPMAILMGGTTELGVPTSAVWAYDGNDWAVINEGFLPAMTYPMMARYVVYRETPAAFKKREFDVWMIFGGFTQDNIINREVYISYDNGVHWSLAPDEMQLSNKFPNLAKSDVIVADEYLSADLSDAWTLTEETKTRAQYTIDGFDITWQCPYLYIFGGYNVYNNYSLNTYIYRGVLERLKFTPSL